MTLFGKNDSVRTLGMRMKKTRTMVNLLLAAVAAAILLPGCGSAVRNNDIRLGFEASEEELWDDALSRWEKAVAAAPRSAAAHNNLAVAYEKKGRWEDARKEYETALALDPLDIRIKHNFERFQENMSTWKDGAEKARGGGRR